jgi:hypothetical protein
MYQQVDKKKRGRKDERKKDRKLRRKQKFMVNFVTEVEICKIKRKLYYMRTKAAVGTTSRSIIPSN